MVYRMVVGGKNLNIAALIFLIIIPLLLIFLQEPLSRIVARRRDIMPENKGEYFTESSFELLEILLNYVTNTISFIRVGAFALIHAGMMMVVWEFGDMMSGAGSIILLIFGNLFVMGMEGFLVGIQVLRLEFYEMFGRFFDGEGKAFRPFDIHEVKKV